MNCILVSISMTGILWVCFDTDFSLQNLLIQNLLIIYDEKDPHHPKPTDDSEGNKNTSPYRDQVDSLNSETGRLILAVQYVIILQI